MATGSISEFLLEIGQHGFKHSIIHTSGSIVVKISKCHGFKALLRWIAILTVFLKFGLKFHARNINRFLHANSIFYW
jgi:hypothetical protein